MDNEARHEPSKLEVRFWGVRGSIPSPGPDTALVGGNTSCVEVRSATTRIILDAGTGLRALGSHLVDIGDHRDNHIFLSHVHWDHVMGLPFFAPLYRSDSMLHIRTGASGQPLADVLRRQMSAPMFPVDIKNVPSKVRCEDLRPGARLRVGDLDVFVERLNHPDPVYAYRIECGDSSVVYATDHEHGSESDARLTRMARGADVLIYDAQYTPEEYTGSAGGMPKTGWGHSTYEAGARVAREAKIGTLALFHHDPGRKDQEVAEMVGRARQLFPTVVAAREQMSLSLPRSV